MLLAAAAPLGAQNVPAPQPVRGFPGALLATERLQEDVLRAVPSPDTLRAQLIALSAFPHEAGTDRSRRVAEAILARFRSFGLDASIEQFEALMPRPVSRSLQLLAPERYTAQLREPSVPGDPTSGQPDQLPTFNAYSPDGDVTGDLVYVNYGRPDDYRILDSLGISVRGKIVIARYGGSWRGIKPKVAAEHGAIGCLIYSDPRDDGFFGGDTYPLGPMRPSQGVQRGSVMDMPTYPGDPLSPGWASEPGSRRLSRAEARTLATIPVLPISYGDALPFLRNLAGPVAPEAWRGALADHLPRRAGTRTGAARRELRVEDATAVRRRGDDPRRGVPGRVGVVRQPPRCVGQRRGGPDLGPGLARRRPRARSALCCGAAGARPGPSSWPPGTARSGGCWAPPSGRRSTPTSWSPRLSPTSTATPTAAAGSAPAAPRRWRRSCGRWPGTCPTRPGKPPSALEAAQLHHRQESVHDTTRAGSDTAFSIGALGSGSDYTAFIDHLGVASLDVRYGGAVESGIYHSVYDDYTFYLRFLDTALTAEVAEARTVGTAILRLADAPVLPFEFGAVARNYRRYADEIARLAARSDTTRGLDLAPLRGAVARLDSAAQRYEAALSPLERMTAVAVAARHDALDRVNRMLFRTERAVTDTAGLPRRPWFRNLIYAPGLYTGYGVKTMPGIREAVELGRPDEAQAEAARVTSAIGRLAAEVDRAATALGEALK